MLAKLFNNLGLRLFVILFGCFVALLVLLRLLAAIDLTWFLPDGWWSWAAAPSGPAMPPAPPPVDCVPMPDGIEVCEPR